MGMQPWLQGDQRPEAFAGLELVALLQAAAEATDIQLLMGLGGRAEAQIARWLKNAIGREALRLAQTAQLAITPLGVMPGCIPDGKWTRRGAGLVNQSLLQRSHG